MVLSKKSPLSGISSIEGLLGERTTSSGKGRWELEPNRDSYGIREKSPHTPVGVGVKRRVIKEPGGKLPENRHVAGKQQKLLELAAKSSSFAFQSSPKEFPGMCTASG